MTVDLVVFFRVQFMKHFVNDCKDLIYTFFFDSFRLPRLADRLEEDFVHHLSVLNRCNARNASFRLDVSTSLFFPKRSIAGAFRLVDLFVRFSLAVFSSSTTDRIIKRLLPVYGNTITTKIANGFERDKGKGSWILATPLCRRRSRCDYGLL